MVIVLVPLESVYATSY